MGRRPSRDGFSGAKFQSNFPVAAYGGNNRAYVPSADMACDFLDEQLFPTREHLRLTSPGEPRPVSKAEVARYGCRPEPKRGALKIGIGPGTGPDQSRSGPSLADSGDQGTACFKRHMSTSKIASSKSKVGATLKSTFGCALWQASSALGTSYRIDDPPRGTQEEG